jgi:hypothetical protein
MPALKILTPFSANCTAVSNTCARLSALQGPAMIIGHASTSIPGKTNLLISISQNFNPDNKFMYFTSTSKEFKFF